MKSITIAIIIIIQLLQISSQNEKKEEINTLYHMTSAGGAIFHPKNDKILIYSSNEKGRIQIYKVEHNGEKLITEPKSKIKKIKKG
jgi:hypothetical protein